MSGVGAAINPVLKVLRNHHFWLIAAMLVTCASLHYGSHIELVALLSGRLPLGLTRHALDRILFLLPITYTGFVFGPVKGLFILLAAALIMLPRAIFMSSSPADAVLETTSVLIVGGLIILWFESLEKEKTRRMQAIADLEVAQRELKFHVQVIEEDRRQLAALSTISTIVSQSLKLELVLRGALDKIMELMQVDAALAFLLDEETQEIVLAAHRGVSIEFVQGVARMKLGEGFNGSVAQSGQPMVVQDASQDPQLTRVAVKKEKLQSQLIVPLRTKGKVLGTLCVAMRGPRQFLSEEIDLFSHIANNIGVAVENARLYEQAQLIAEQLRISEKNYRDLFENASDAIWVHDMDGTIVAANRACAKLWGYTKQEAIGMNVRSFLLPEGLEIAREVRQKLLKGQGLEQPYEQTLTSSEGIVRTMKVATSLLTRDGQPISFQHVGRDVTEEKKMQENLRFYAQQVTKAQEEERKRIARELHDDTSQSLIALSRQLDTLIDSSDQLPQLATKRLEELHQQVNSIQEGVRRFSQDLRPSILDDLGLVPALEWLASNLKGYSGIDTQFKVVGEGRRLPHETELLLFRVAQEALRNVWRHSQASQVWVTIEFAEDKIKIVVQDNGKGFQLPERLDDLASIGKLGLAGMWERAQLLGGTLTVQSEPGDGTTTVLVVPA